MKKVLKLLIIVIFTFIAVGCEHTNDDNNIYEEGNKYNNEDAPNQQIFEEDQKEAEDGRYREYLEAEDRREKEYLKKEDGKVQPRYITL